MSNILGATETNFRFAVLYGGLTTLLAVAMFVFGALGPFKAQPRSIPVVRVVAPATASALVKKWGTPSTVLKGEQISSKLTGSTCVIYNSRKAVLCYIP